MVALPSVSKTLVVWDWSAFSNPDLWTALFSFLYLDFLVSPITIIISMTLHAIDTASYLNSKGKS